MQVQLLALAVPWHMYSCGVPVWFDLRFPFSSSPLKAGFSLWGSGMVMTGLYLWKFKSHRPLSQNIIHARMVAQFGVIVGLCTGAAISAMELPKGHVAATSEERLLAINKAHEAAFTEEIEIEAYEAQMHAEDIAAAEAAAASPDTEKL